MNLDFDPTLLLPKRRTGQFLVVDEFVGGEASAALIMGLVLQGDDAAAGVLDRGSDVVDIGAWV